MSKVLLISINQCTMPETVFPLGLAYLSGALRQAGHHCAWLDFLSLDGGVAEAVSNFAPDLVGISLRNIDDVLIRKQETFFGGLASLVQIVRQNAACPILLGGSGFSIFPAELMQMADADYGITGEGEASIVALLEALDGQGDCGSIPGLVYRRGAKIVINPAAPERGALELPEPDRPAAIMASYLQNGGGFNVQTQRGCPHRCCYCTYPLIEGKSPRWRSPESVAAEFDQLQRAGARYVFIVDSVFNSSAQHVAVVCETLARRKLQLRWGCFLRPQGLTPELMRLMAQAGLAHIEFGSDSFCDEVLAAYGKGFTFDDILFSSQLAAREQIDCCHFLIAGGPGETRETLDRTFENSQRLARALFMAVVGMRIYPGTSLLERAVAEGQANRDADLLNPAYYVTPGLTPDTIFAQLTRFARSSPNWIIGDAEPGYQKLVTRLRQRGIAGPLWSYFSLVKQIRPAELGRS